MLVLGMSGAVTALGDTLFPVSSLAEGEAQTFSESAHLFVRLRIWHPTLAVVVGAVVVVAALLAARRGREELTRRAADAAIVLFAVQLAVGVVNVWLLAPVGLQILHLLLTDLIWIALVLLAASVFAESE
jgi:heme A synthase